jgi:Cu(I)/Ag(I) efflux system membrane fusion protein
MANNNSGADWLSLEKVIKNPYFGDKMLTCGSVVRIIE